MKTIGIIGTRSRDTSSAYKKVEEKFLELYKVGDKICSGGCAKGADRFAQKIAKKHGAPILIFYPDYNTYPKGAPFIRNGDIAENSDVLIACVAKDRLGGTEDTITKYTKKFNKTKLYIL